MVRTRGCQLQAYWFGKSAHRVGGGSFDAQDIEGLVEDAVGAGAVAGVVARFNEPE